MTISRDSKQKSPRKPLRCISHIALFAAIVSTTAQADAFTLDYCKGNLESAALEWQPVDGAVAYDVIYSGAGLDETKADRELIRLYASAIRADIPGLAAGDYNIYVTALDASGNPVDRSETATATVLPHVREGFAFDGGNMPGAYKADGTLKEGAQVIYVTPETVNTVTLDVIKNDKKQTDTKTGLAEILNAIGKGYHKTPLAIRFIGSIADTQFEGLKDANYINFQGNNNSTRLIENITLEGIGDDAALYGYGICFKRAHNIEIRNVAIMLYGDDAISMDTDNTNIWLHNIDFFYGKPGKDADQVKGDGSIDMKYHSTDITINNNHFFDSGKVMGCGGTTGENENLRITFHHNWFDHADSRCPRLHYTTAHIYNNYYDGVAVYGIGNTTETSAFIENNYFRNVKRPFMISGQGTDSYDTSTGTYTLKGTFSGQDGGMTKAYNNIFAENTPAVVYHTQHPTQFDAYLASSRTEQVPASVVSYKGKWPYSNFDTADGMYVSVPDAPKEVPAIVTAYAGRTDGGDIRWTFDNAVDDTHHAINAPLKALITDYKSRLLEVQSNSGFDGSSAIMLPTADATESPVKVFDISGRMVLSSPSGNLDSSLLPAGIYIVRKGTLTNKIIVK